MICKWCGANTPDSKAKCTRCGRPLPPKSDCGGFYDIVPDAKKVLAARSHPTPSAGGTITYVEVPGEPDKKYQIIFLSVCAALLISLILMFVYMGKAGNLQEEVNDLEERIRALTPVEQDEDPPGSDIDFDIFKDFKDKEITAEIDLFKSKQNDSEEDADGAEDQEQEETDVAAIPVESDLDGFTCEYQDGTLVLKYNDTLCFTAKFSEYGSRQQVKFSHAANILGEEGENALKITLEKRSEDDDWEKLSRKDKEVSFVNDKVLYESDEDYEYRLTITRENATGGSFTVVISGITAP